MLNVFCYVKVFGERNCGTGFLQQFISANTSLEVLRHGSNAAALSRAEQLPVGLREFARERLLDQQRRREFAENFGWKHSCVSPEYLQQSYKFHHTLFLFLVRNPFVFLASLYRRPYNAFHSSWPDKLSFLISPWLCNERDRLEELLLDSPVHLWNLKNASYLHTQRQLRNALLLSYEALVSEPERLLQRLRDEFGIRTAERIEIPQASTKGDTGSFAQYRERALNYRPDSDFEPSELRAIATRLDWTLYGELGYPQLPDQHRPA